MLDGIKIALGYEIREGPWGGGNQFLASFKDYFEKKGSRIVHHLEEGSDLIILINPLRGSGTFNHKDIIRFKRRNPKTKVITRVNDCNKSKLNDVGDRDTLRLEACKVSDAVVFISEWLRDYYIEKGFNRGIRHTVIRNGVDKEVFNAEGYTPWEPGIPMKIVTHHWSYNWNKGADIYIWFDKLLEDPWMKEQFEFTYIGRLPRITPKSSEVKFKNIRYIPPLSGMALADELKEHHVYLTASRWEPGGMHQLEGACCGLPLIFNREGGGIVESCRGFGVEFTEENFPISLFKMLEQYRDFVLKMNNFSSTADVMNKKYEELILGLF
ncbi:MAG: hypothetical protein M0R66_00175 [Candidatus Omnitrophica bacterium]|nr:hypothetical protein [Candidatus Omnitrophota bacterium]